MIRETMVDLLNAVRLVVAPRSFVAAEHEHIKALNAMSAEPFGPVDRVRLVRHAFWRSALLVLIAFVIGWVWAQAVSFAGYGLIPDWQLRLQAMGAAILLWGTLFVRGWDIQTFGGKTLAERANQTLYRLLCAVGTVLGVFATLCPTLKH